MTLNRCRLLSAFACLLILALTASTLFTGRPQQVHADGTDHRIARALKKDLTQTVRRYGVLKPIKEERIVAKIWGQIVELAPQGTKVNEGDVVLRLDATQYEETKVWQEGQLRRFEAEFSRQRSDSAKTLNQAEADVLSYDLRVELEKMRLEELKKGPTDTERINAEANLENNKNLFAAAEEELAVLGSLLEGGFVSRAEYTQKQLDVNEQRLRVTDSEIARRKLYVEDPVKIAEQQLKVQDAAKTRAAAGDRVNLLKRNIERDEDNHKRRMDRERNKLQEHIDNIAKTVMRAPAKGVVLHKKANWYTLAPGREVYDGMECMSLPDFSRMKVVAAIDEACIGQVSVGKPAEITPVGWTGEPFKGTVVKVAGKGRDEFEFYLWETKQITGTANRQVFEVEVEINGDCSAFRPGSRASVSINVNTLRDTIVVPRMAIFRDANGDNTVRVHKAGSTKIRKVKILMQTGTQAAVEGVNEGEEVWILEEEEKQ
jgi:HlyD family secretion protein